MPTVPRLQQQVEERALPNARITTDAPIEAFGGGRSNAGVFEAAQGLAQAGQKINEDAQNSAFFDADLELSEDQNRLENETKSRLGKNALDASDYNAAEWQKTVDRVTQKYGGVSRARLERAAKLRFSNLSKFTGDHVNAQMSKYDDDRTEAYIKQATNEALQNPDDHERVEFAEFQQQAAIEKHAQRKGISPEELKIKKEMAASSLHKSIIDQLVDSGRDQDAIRYYDKVKGKIAGEDIDDVKKNIAAGTLAGESKRQAESIFSNYGGNLSIALEKARAIQDPKVSDETVRRVKDLFAQEDLADKDRDQRLNREAYDILDQTPDVDNIPRPMWLRFSGAQRSKLISYAKGKREFTQPPANGTEYYDTMMLLSNPSTQMETAKQSLYGLKGQVTDSEFKQLIKIQSGVLNGDGKTKAFLGSVENNNQVISRTLKSAKMSPDTEEGRQFYRRINQMAFEYEEQNGKRPTPEIVQEWTDGLLTEGVIEKRGGKFFDWLVPDTKKRAFELEGSEQIQEGEVPKLERQKIVAWLTQNKKPVTEKNILKLFNLKYGNKDADSSGK